MKIHYEEGRAVLQFPYDERMVRMCHVMGGKYIGTERAWEINEPVFVKMIRWVEKLKNEGRGSFTQLLADEMNLIIHRSQTSEDTLLDIPCPAGLTPTHAQRSAVRWITLRDSTLEADPMGAGKTIMCALAANLLKCRKVLIIVIASVKTNWRMEFRKWNLMAREAGLTCACAQGSFWPGTDVVVVNYDILERFRTRYKFVTDENGNIVKPMRTELVKVGEIDQTHWDLAIVDECHKIKGIKADRTHAIIGEYRGRHCLMEPIKADRKIGMSGTPIVNRPVEIWPIAYWLWPHSFPDFHAFGMRYCGGARKQIFPGAMRKNKKGELVKAKAWDFKGNTNEEELNLRLRLLGMISRPKAITHVGIPEKTRKIIEFDIPALNRLIEDEKNEFRAVDSAETELRTKAEASLVFNDDQGWRKAMSELKESVIADVNRLTKIRLDVARAFLPHVIEYIKEQLAEMAENKEPQKIVVFAWHQEIADALEREFLGKCIKIHGGVPTDVRKSLETRFQTEDSCQLAIGSIGAMGTGMTLTAAALCLFVELHWVPGEMMQAEDRLHRITQTRQCQMRYLVPTGSISAVMAARVIEKLEIIERCTGPIQRAVENIPISLTDLDDEPASTIPYPDLEALSRSVDLTKESGVREILTEVARGRVPTKLHRADQMVASMLCNITAWTAIQQAYAETIVNKYKCSILGTTKTEE